MMVVMVVMVMMVRCTVGSKCTYTNGCKCHGDDQGQYAFHDFLPPTINKPE